MTDNELQEVVQWEDYNPAAEELVELVDHNPAEDEALSLKTLGRAALKLNDMVGIAAVLCVVGTDVDMVRRLFGNISIPPNELLTVAVGIGVGGITVGINRIFH